MDSFIKNIPKTLAEQAYVFNDEAAWPKETALKVISYLSQLDVAILGGEVWVPSGKGPIIPLYQWSAGSRDNYGSFESFVIGANQEARIFISSFKWNDDDTEFSRSKPFFNFVVNERKPNQINRLERQLLDALLEGDDELLESLREQLKQAVIVNRELTGVGFFLNFSVPKPAPKVKPDRIIIGDVIFDLAGLEHGGGAILFTKNGYISQLEGYLNAEEWPDEPQLTRVYY